MLKIKGWLISFSTIHIEISFPWPARYKIVNPTICWLCDSKAPTKAVSIKGGEAVLICDNCAKRLERQGVIILK